MIRRLKEKLLEFKADYNMQEILRSTIIAFLIKAFGAGISFLFNVVISRLLGAEGVGVYFLALSITAIASVIGRLGLDNALLRFIAINAARNKWDIVKSVHTLGMQLAILASGLVSLIVFIVAPWACIELFNKPELIAPLRWMCFSILPFSLFNLYAESLKGTKHIKEAMIIQNVALPSIALVLILLFFQSKGVAGAAVAYTLSSFTVLMLSLLLWKSSTGTIKRSENNFSFEELWLSCRPLFLASLVNRGVLPWAPLFILGIWVESEDVGIFGAALRVSMLVSFLLIAVNSVISPFFADLFAKGKIEELGRLTKSTAVAVTFLVTPLLLLLAFYGKNVMMFFGDSFESGYLVLLVLVLGQFINVFTGSVGYLLMMTGNEQTYNHCNFYSTLILLVMCIILIPLFGSVGAALATSFSVAFLNLWMAYCVRKKININVLPLDLFGKVKLK